MELQEQFDVQQLADLFKVLGDPTRIRIVRLLLLHDEMCVTDIAEAMEMGAAAIMANTAIATAGDLPLMAKAFRLAIEAGHDAYVSGLGRVRETADASDPLTGFLGD